MLSGEQTETYLLDKLKKKAPPTNHVFQQPLLEFMEWFFPCLLPFVSEDTVSIPMICHDMFAKRKGN